MFIVKFGFKTEKKALEALKKIKGVEVRKGGSMFADQYFVSGGDRTAVIAELEKAKAMDEMCVWTEM